MPKVFISHSKQDRELTANIAVALKNIGADAIVMEYIQKDTDVPDWQKIRNAVQESDYMMLFKTDNMIITSYTHSWIIYEVGLAAALGKKVFVFERKGPEIHFPIPYLTDYKIFEPNNVKDVLGIQSIAKAVHEEMNGSHEESLTPIIPKFILDSGLLVGDLRFYAEIISIGILAVAKYYTGPVPIKCNHCHSNYHYHENANFTPFTCPVCLHQVTTASLGSSK